jgi:hypothetical protein
MLQLSGYVANEVARMTGDAQHPTPYYRGFHDFDVADVVGK